MIFDYNKKSSVVYNKIRKLGAGAFGVTYMVTQEGDITGKRYVLKTIGLDPKFKTDPTLIANVFNEVNVLAKIAKYGCKKTLLCYHDYFISFEDNKSYINIVTEAFDDAITLTELIKTNQKYQLYFTRRELLKIMNGLMEGLAYLHKIGIAHGDIKPDNILINKDLEIQIIDFGLSCSKNCRPSGTVLFASPEILKSLTGKKNIPLEDLQKADVFSMGIVFYLLANLEFPFQIQGRNPYIMIPKVQSIVEPLVDVVNKQVQKDEESPSLIYQYSDLDKQLNELELRSFSFSNDDKTQEEELIEEINKVRQNIKEYQSWYKSIKTFRVNNENDSSAIFTLFNFYNNKGKKIMSFYNFGQTDVDNKINALIESMLVISTKIKGGRPSAKRVLTEIRKTIELYNMPLSEDKQILLTPISATLMSPKTPKTPVF